MDSTASAKLGAGASRGSPDRCIAIDSRVTSAISPSRSGHTAPRRVSVSIAPRSIASAKRAAVNVFVIEPISKSVCSSAPVPAKVTSSPSMRAADTCCQWPPPSACATSLMSAASPGAVPWNPRGHGAVADRTTAVTAAGARAAIRSRDQGSGIAYVRWATVSVIAPPGDQGRDGRWSVRTDEDEGEQRDDPCCRDPSVPADGAFEPPGPGQSMHMVIDLTGRAETLHHAERGHGCGALIARRQQLAPDAMAERCQTTGRLREIDLLQPLPRHPHLPGHGCLSPGGSGVPGVGHPIAEVVDESAQGPERVLVAGEGGGGVRGCR